MINLEPHLFPDHMLNAYDLKRVPDCVIVVNECNLSRLTKGRKLAIHNYGVLIYYGGITIVHAITIHSQAISCQIAKALKGGGKIDHAAVFERLTPNSYKIVQTY